MFGTEHNIMKNQSNVLHDFTNKHGHRKDFFQRGQQWIFLGAAKEFSNGGPKMVKFHFTHSKLRKQPFFC